MKLFHNPRQQTDRGIVQGIAKRLRLCALLQIVACMTDLYNLSQQQH